MQCKNEGRKSIYVGESSRTLGECAHAHKEDSRNQKETSHIATHRLEDHKEVVKISMKFKVNKVCRTALKSQVRKTVIIKMKTKEGFKLVNNKIEYNRCHMPEITVPNGDKEESKKGEESRNH